MSGDSSQRFRRAAMLTPAAPPPIIAIFAFADLDTGSEAYDISPVASADMPPMPAIFINLRLSILCFDIVRSSILAFFAVKKTLRV